MCSDIERDRDALLAERDELLQGVEQLRAGWVLLEEFRAIDNGPPIRPSEYRLKLALWIGKVHDLLGGAAEEARDD